MPRYYPVRRYGAPARRYAAPRYGYKPRYAPRAPYFNRGRTIYARPRYKRPRNAKPTIAKLNTIETADVALVKLKYQDTFRLTQAAGAIQFQNMSGNSMYDPDTSGTGHQPLGFDRWTAFYETYMVSGSAIKVTIINNRTSNNARVFLQPTDDLISTDTESKVIEETQYIKSTILGGRDTGKNSVTWTNYMSTKKIFGEKELDESLYEGAMGNTLTGTSPNAQWYWQVGGVGLPSAAALELDLTVQITITYFAKLRGRVTPTTLD